MWRIGVVSGFVQIESAWGLRRWSTAEVTAEESELGLDPVSRSRILSGRGVSYDEMDIKLLDLVAGRRVQSIVVFL